MIKKTLKRGYDFLLSGNRRANKMALDDLGVVDKLDELLYHLHGVKNAVTFKTGEHEALTRIFTGQKMYVDTRDISVAPHLMMDGHWEPEITTIFRQHVTPQSVVFDIGANFGYFGLVAGTDIDRTKGQLHFFEANPDLTPFILKTLAINGLLPYSQIVTKAVSDKAGTVELTVLDGFVGSSGIDLDDKNLNNLAGSSAATIRQRLNVPTITIDQYVHDKQIKAVDIIKMDIEGHEDKAYSGMRGTVKKSPRLKMFIEFTDDAYKDAKKFFGHLIDDFGNIYAISNKGGGTLTKVTSYATLKKMMDDRWIMLLASKKPITA